MTNKKSVQDIITATILQLESEALSPETVKGFRRIFNKFLVFCEKNQIQFFSADAGKAYCENVRNQHPEYCADYVASYERAIRRLNCVANGTTWMPLRKPRQGFVSSHFDIIFYKYSEYLVQMVRATKYQRTQLHNVSKFLGRVEAAGIKEIEQLTVRDIYDIFTDWDCDNYRMRRDTSAFLKYAYIYKIIPLNLADAVPKAQRHHAVPSVYSPEEVETMLSSVDRTTEIGKRDYAVLLIAARLGLRASDIAPLTFDNLKAETIELVQVKTKRKLSLPLLSEVKAAIDDYVDNVRPLSDIREIFLNTGGYGSISPENVGAIAHRAFLRAGINCEHRRSGSHALRASLATALLAEGNSYFAVQKVLDHVDVQTAKAYAKADIEQLRICAIPVPTPTGNFAALLGERGGAI